MSQAAGRTPKTTRGTAKAAAEPTSSTTAAPASEASELATAPTTAPPAGDSDKTAKAKAKAKWTGLIGAIKDHQFYAILVALFLLLATPTFLIGRRSRTATV